MSFFKNLRLFKKREQQPTSIEEPNNNGAGQPLPEVSSDTMVPSSKQEHEQEQEISEEGITVIIKGCRGLSLKEDMRKIDPFVRVSMVNRLEKSYGFTMEDYGPVHTTDVAFQTKNPVFNEKVVLPVENMEDDLISFKVYHDTRGVKNPTNSDSSSQDSSRTTEKQGKEGKRRRKRERIGSATIACSTLENCVSSEDLSLPLDCNGGFLDVSIKLPLNLTKKDKKKKRSSKKKDKKKKRSSKKEKKNKE